MEKFKKEKQKMEKEHESKMKEVKCELKKSMDEACSKVQENVKLEEEKKTLQGILKMNTEIYEKRKEEINRKIDEEVNEEDEDDFIEVMTNNRQNGFSRTSPAFGPETVK